MGLKLTTCLGALQKNSLVLTPWVHAVQDRSDIVQIWSDDIVHV